MTHLTVRIPVRDKSGAVVGHKEVARYAGLLSKAHDEGLSSILTELVQAPTPDNGRTAVVRAHVTTSKGSFTGLGDADPENVSPSVVRHLLRVAETRAKARALRDAVNIGEVALEELGAELDDGALYEGRVVPLDGSRRAPTEPRAQSPSTVPTPPDAPRADAPHAAEPERAPRTMTDAQRKYLFRLLAQKGTFGTDARLFLQKTFGAERLDGVPRDTASKLIDRLVAESGNGEQSHDAP